MPARVVTDRLQLGGGPPIAHVEAAPQHPRPARLRRASCSCSPGGARCALCQRGAQLDAAGRAVRRAREDVEDLVRAAHALVVLAVDNGMTQKEAASWAGLSQPHVNRILTRSQPEVTVSA